MSISPQILEDFIDSVSVCSSKADLDTVLRIIQSSQHQTIAVIDREKHPIGVINGNRILAFIFKQWSLVSQASTKFVEAEPNKTDTNLADNFKLTQWIEPVVNLSTSLSVEEILAYVNRKILTENKSQNYLVTNKQGKLLGLLDTFRLSQWLFSTQIKLDRILPKQKTPKPTPSNYLPIFKLIEQIPVPLKLQKSSGETLYQNQYWQEKVGTAKISNLLEVSQCKERLYPNLSLTNSHYTHQETTSYCLKGNYYLSPYFANLTPKKITFNSQTILDESGRNQSSIAVDYLENDRLELRTSDSDLPEKNQLDWKYLKLPLNWTESKSRHPNLATEVWLVIGLKMITPEKIDRSFFQASELIKLNQLKDKFLANISHELKSPLTSIVGLSSLLKEEKLGQLNQRQVRYSELIYRSGKQLMKIVSNILELTYLATDKFELNFEPIKIESLCTEVYRQVLTQLEESLQFVEESLTKPQFKLSIEKDLEFISADKIRLRQILTYLLDNALKFVMEKKTPLSSQLKTIAITINNWGNWIAITVTDNGSGIPEENQRLILEQRFLSQSDRVPRYNDIALRLIMAQQLAKIHGGNISFTSSCGRGSSFTVLLPHRYTEVAPEIISDFNTSLKQSLEQSYNYYQIKQSPEEQLASQSNLFILVIDSVESQVNQLNISLQELGYYPIIARTPSEALDKARQFKPSKILLNSAVSKTFETDILTLLKAELLTTKIPVFLLVSNQEEQQNYSQAEGFLSLPIKHKSLIKIVPSVYKKVSQAQKRLTILHLYPESEITSNLKIIRNNNLNFALNEHLSGLNHRVLEADSLEQGELLARIWQIDAIVLDGRILQEPLLYLRSLRKSASLSSLPLVTLDTKTTQAANKIEGLSVFPCLLPEEKSNLANLVQVIQIATGIKNN